MKFFFDMVGCRLNQAELEAMADSCVQRQAEVVKDPQEADVIVLNTCCVTLKACADSRKMLRAYQRKTNAVIWLTGCWASAFAEEAQGYLPADQIVSNARKDGLITELLVGAPLLPALDTVKPDLGKRHRTRAFLKVQDGCRNACSFCLTQIARGESVSRPLEEAVHAVDELLRRGQKEVVLSGVQLGAWGKDLGEERLADLVHAILLRTNLSRLRLSSIEPWDVDERLLSLFENSRLCPHLHIPMQSGADVVLRNMYRPMNAQAYEALIVKIRARYPDMALSTDVIAGFPGETESDFEQSCRLLQKLGFSSGHVFQYSPMPGTQAQTRTDQLPSAVIHRRAARLQTLLADSRHAFANGMLGKHCRVLVETEKKVDGRAYACGHSENFELIYVCRAGLHRNEILDVLVEHVDSEGRIFAQPL